MMRLRPLLAVVALLALAACAAYGPRANVPDFDLLGRVFVGYEGPSFSSNLRWSHAGSEDQIWLMTPLGQTLAYIEDRATGASLTSADQQQYHAGSVESLTKRALGWALPLAELRYWVRGEEVPGVPSEGVQRSADGRLLELTQAGWKITFTPPPPHIPSRLPQRLQLTNGSQQIRLVIDEWRELAKAP
ncbi:MAG: lipoprotein insertase outer membrane protein LolB [Rhodospirillaceae bacterium]